MPSIVCKLNIKAELTQVNSVLLEISSGENHRQGVLVLEGGNVEITCTGIRINENGTISVDPASGFTYVP